VEVPASQRQAKAAGRFLAGDNRFDHGNRASFNVGEHGLIGTRNAGWRPTCDHGDDSGKCIVFDPFCGSGTVGAVALKFRRRFVGIDLSREYLRDLAYERANSGQPLLFLP